jgi:L-aminopeptidase/D-esterase-like protein
VIGVVATNAKLDKEAVNKVAQMGQDGLAQAIRPAHGLFDGDTLFALAAGQIPANVNVIGAFAAEVVAEAIRNAVRAATSLGGIPAARNVKTR